MNGFKVEPKSDDSNTILVKSLPASKKVTFTVDDFTELIHIVSENLDQDSDKPVF